MYIYSITILVAGAAFLFISKSLFRGNTNLVHGKTFENSKDKVAFTKKLGWPILILGIVWIIASIISILNTRDLYFYISYALFIGGAIYLLIHMSIIDKNEVKKQKEEHEK